MSFHHHELTPEHRGENEDAARAMFSLLGGPTGYFQLSPDNRLHNFSGILHADPSDDLSGLRLIASRMQDTATAGPRSANEARSYIEPSIARWWLISSKRVDVVDGELCLKPKPDHLTLAALSIANAELGSDFYEAYAAASDSNAPLSRALVNDIAENIIDSYFANQDEATL